MGYEDDGSPLQNCLGVGEDELISADVCVEPNDEGFEELPESISKHSWKSLCSRDATRSNNEPLK